MKDTDHYLDRHLPPGSDWIPSTTSGRKDKDSGNHDGLGQSRGPPVSDERLGLSLRLWLGPGLRPDSERRPCGLLDGVSV